MKRSFVLLLSFSSLVSAQTINSIEFKGLKHISNTIASEMVQMSRGDRLDIAQIDKSIKKFYSLGYFKDIWVEDKGSGELVFNFVEKPLIAKVEIKGYYENKEEELSELLGIKTGDIYDESKIEDAKAKIIAAASSEGYFGTIVEEERTTLDGGGMKVLFKVNRGEHIKITRMHLCGREELSMNDFDDLVANKAEDTLGWLWGFNDGNLKLAELPLDQARIKDIYMQNGYLDAKVSEPLLKVDLNNYSASLDYHVEEGEKYVLDSVEIQLDNPVIEKEELYEDLKERNGDLFNVSKLRKDVEHLRVKIADLGYAFAKVMPDFRKNENTGKMELIYRIKTGEKVKVRDVLISGNQKTIDRVIRREVYIAPNEYYSVTDLKDSIASLKRTGYFEDVTVDEKKVSPTEMDLVVKVKEIPTGNIMVGGGYGSYEGFMINGSITDRNIFGTGMDVGLTGDISGKHTRFSLSLYNPRILDSQYSLSTSIFNNEYQAYDYTSKVQGASVAFGRRFTRNLSGSLQYKYENTELKDLEIALDPLYYPKYKYSKSALTPTLSYNNTDDFYLPRKGVIASTSLEYAGVGGDEEFIKSYSKLSLFYGLRDEFDLDVIFRYKARLGVAQDEGFLPINEKFYIGGIGTVRGYKGGSLSPKNNQDKLIGGSKFFTNAVEMSLPFITKAKMRVALFYDFGMIGENKFNEVVRGGYGGALEWQSPMGPLNLVFATPENKHDGDRTASFEFTMGYQY